MLADYGDPQGIELIVDAMERYRPEAEDDAHLAATILASYRSSLARLGHELSPELRAKCERAHQAAYRDSELDERPDGRSLEPARPRIDQRKRKKARKNRRKQQRASLKKPIRLLYCLAYFNSQSDQ